MRSERRAKEQEMRPRQEWQFGTSVIGDRIGSCQIISKNALMQCSVMLENVAIKQLR